MGSVSDDLYNGCPAAAAGDAIIVAANYRLGPLGFLVIPDTNITGNQALQDQLLAARWVRDNIVAFGGDRERILLFGQSAGARDTAVLATLPASGGLLAAAAMESGGFGKDIPRAVDRTGPHARWARDVGCAARDVGCLRAAPMDVLVAAARNVSSAGWGPVVDGTMVTQQPAAAGLAVPAIVGVTTAETANGLLERVGGPGVMARLDGTVYNEFLQQMFRGQAGAVNASYSLARFYTNTSMLYGADADAARGAAVFRAIVRIQTEREYLCPLQKGLRAEAARGGRSPGVWGYVWDQAPGCAWLGGMDADTARVLGPAHSSEIPYVFGEVAALPPGGLGNCGFDDGDRNISRFVMRAWTHMATKGRPVDVDGSWPRFVQGKGNEKGLTIRNGRVIPGTLDFTACDFWARVDASLKASSGSAFGTSWSVRDLTLAFVLVRLASMVVF